MNNIVFNKEFQQIVKMLKCLYKHGHTFNFFSKSYKENTFQFYCCCAVLFSALSAVVTSRFSAIVSLTWAVTLKSGIVRGCDREQPLVRQGEQVLPGCALLFLLWKSKVGSYSQQLSVTGFKEIK